MENNTTNLKNYLAEVTDAGEHTFWGYLGCELDVIDEQRIVISLEIQPHHLNVMGILHGGVHATLLDSAMGLMAMAVNPGQTVVTTNLNLHYVAPAKQGKISVTAEIVHQSRKTITLQGRVLNDSEEMCAYATGTFRIIDKR